MKRKVRMGLAATTLLVGVACLAYPVVSNAILSAAQHKVAEESIVAVQELDTSAIGAERERALRYNENLAAGRTSVTDPFDPDRAPATEEEYFATLDVSGNGVMAVLDVPDAGIVVPVYHGTTEDVLTEGAGHLVGTSLPVGGPSSHCVIAGHTGLPSVKVFDKLDTVKEGCIIRLETLDETLCYRVFDVEVVEPDQTDSLLIEEGEDLLTLVTCTPYGINSHRLLVHAARTDSEDVIEDEAVLVQPLGEGGAFLLAGVLAACAVACIALLVWRRGR